MEQPSDIAEIHIGQILKRHITKNKISKAALARKLDCDESYIQRYLRRDSLQLNIIVRLCHALRHNFFADIAAELPQTYSVTLPPDDSKDRRIAELEQEIAILKSEKAVLMEVVKK